MCVEYSRIQVHGICSTLNTFIVLILLCKGQNLYLGGKTCTVRLATLGTSKHYLRNISIFLQHVIGPQNLSTHGTLTSKHTQSRSRSECSRLQLSNLTQPSSEDANSSRDDIQSVQSFSPKYGVNVSSYLLIFVFGYMQVHK